MYNKVRLLKQANCNVDCEPSLYFAISGPGMEDSLVWSSVLMQVEDWGEILATKECYDRACAMFKLLRTTQHLFLTTLAFRYQTTSTSP